MRVLLDPTEGVGRETSAPAAFPHQVTLHRAGSSQMTCSLGRNRTAKDSEHCISFYRTGSRLE